ncbi:MAG: hypothetical protein Q4E21_03680 [Clostridia bacterium]|nr:hypothetical protein [Clostridia bacterium]
MKYCIENRLDLFEFHDAEFAYISFENNNLSVSVRHLNIHKDAKENPHDYDMEIESATVSFRGVQVLSFEPMRAYKMGNDGNLYTDEPQIIFKNVEAKARFTEELKKGITLNCIDIHPENEKTIIEIPVSAKNCFIVTFSFDSISVEWDAYCQKAWYEFRKVRRT